MQRSLFCAPELPGQDSKEIPAMCKARLDEYRRSRQNAGLTMERVYRMQTPMGAITTVYAEGELDFGGTMYKWGTSGLKIDQDFFALLHKVHGIDASKPPPGPPNELLGAWSDPNAKGRGKGLAFTAPVLPGATDYGRAFAKEAFHDRIAEFAASRKAFGGTVEAVMLNHTPMGDMICVYIEGADPVASNRAFAASKTPYDRWFKDSCRKIFPPTIDFDQPLPPIEELWSWQA